MDSLYITAIRDCEDGEKYIKENLPELIAKLELIESNSAPVSILSHEEIAKLDSKLVDCLSIDLSDDKLCTGYQYAYQKNYRRVLNWYRVHKPELRKIRVDDIKYDDAEMFSEQLAIQAELRLEPVIRHAIQYGLVNILQWCADQMHDFVSVEVLYHSNSLEMLWQFCTKDDFDRFGEHRLEGILTHIMDNDRYVAFLYILSIGIEIPRHIIARIIDAHKKTFVDAMLMFGYQDKIRQRSNALYRVHNEANVQFVKYLESVGCGPTAEELDEILAMEATCHTNFWTLYKQA